MDCYKNITIHEKGKHFSYGDCRELLGILRNTSSNLLTQGTFFINTP